MGSVCHRNDLFVAVTRGSDNIITSSDGIEAIRGDIQDVRIAQASAMIGTDGNDKIKSLTF